MGSSKPPSDPTAAPSPEHLAPIRFSTRDYPVNRQFDAWRDFMSPAIELNRPAGVIGGFAAEQTVWDLGRFALTRAIMPSEGPPRMWRHLGRDPLDHWCLVLVRQGAGVASGATARTPGRLYVRSLGRPYFGSATDGEVISLYLPRDTMDRHSARFEQLPPDLGRSALLDLLADYIASLEQRLGDLRIDELPGLVQATEAMLVACLLPTTDHVADSRQVLSLSVVERAKRLIRQELYSPDLTPDFLARTIGVSRSGLYRLFEPFGGVRNAIQRERLLAAHAALSDPTVDEPILTVAERSGFGDASGFSRAFRKEFGCSPSDVRAAAAVGTTVAALSRQNRSEGGDLGRVLRRLHG